MKEYFLKGKLVTVHGTCRISDMEGSLLYEVKGKVLSPTEQTSLLDTEGNEVAHIHKKVMSLHETHYIEMGGQLVTELRTKPLHIMHQEIDLPELGWKITGNVAEHDFSLLDENGEELAKMHRAWLSLGEGYHITVAREEDEVLVLAIATALERIMAARAAARATGSVAAGAQMQSNNAKND